MESLTSGHAISLAFDSPLPSTVIAVVISIYDLETHIEAQVIYLIAIVHV
jgi:hypothetical protein